MAKKGQAVQLQTEVGNDEEWDKLLQKDGLILVDIYSDWCGPCQGMSANLKKLKLEIGGDSLQLAMAKCDNIAQLQRFRNKSEPTWMFISKRKMVNLMFGADAPKLRLLILDELKQEQAAAAEDRVREGREITELSDEEQERYDAADSIAQAARAKEEAKYAKELKERRTAECQNILENLSMFGVILILPNAREKYAEALSDLISEAGLVIQQTEKVKLTEQIVEELDFFSDVRFSSRSLQDCLNMKISLALLMKRSSEQLSGNIDEVILQVVYGNSRKPPGDEGSPSHKLMMVDEGDDNEDNILIGIWVPQNRYGKAFTLKNLFPNISGPFKVPEIEPAPHFVAVGYDAFKARDVIELSNQFPGQVMSLGFFTSDIPPAAQLIAKTPQQFEERTTPTTYDEKIVIQLAKTNPSCVMAFAELGPSYMSIDSIAGEIDCRYFFPKGYNIAEEEVAEVKKKSKKKGKSKQQTAASNHDETVSLAPSDLNKEGEEETEDIVSDEDKCVDGAFDDGEEKMVGADKATSPIEVHTHLE